MPKPPLYEQEFSAKLEAALAELWLAALDSQFGIRVATPDPEGLRRRLYIQRRVMLEKHPRLDLLKVTFAPESKKAEGSSVWIMWKDPRVREIQEVHSSPE
jgi:hypothetical protein